MSIGPIAPRSALSIADQKHAAPTEQGPKPYTRSGSASGPHFPGAAGGLGSARVNINMNGSPTHLAGFYSNGKPFVAGKAQSEPLGTATVVQGEAANSSISNGERNTVSEGSTTQPNAPYSAGGKTV